MITDEELRIANTSYINKDFAAIYPEVVEVVQALTNLWDPETSNESDPGVVLLKLLSFVADKNDYNIDKNVLECFMPSATQESSMRKLCDMLGYFMNYYNAPTTNVTVTYQNVFPNNTIITLEPLKTTFTSNDEDSNVSFILTERITLQKQGEVAVKPVIQGRVRELLVNTSGDVETINQTDYTKIQLSNLDDNNRIYFPEINVAQNGIFISDDTSGFEYSDVWHRVDNLNYQKADEKCFKFGFDSTKGLPYLEFPRDIANLIGSGLRIQYVVTEGLNGNVKANVINKLDSSTVNWELFGDDAETYLFVRNYSATTNGADPESIDGAYNGFKKTVGTFNTLVTCRDYANAIYNALDSAGIYSLVSNIQVSDRRDDFNYSKRVVSYDNLGDVVLNETDVDDLNAYQLCAYPLAPIYAFNDIASYNESFMPLTRGGKTITSAIDTAIEENKTISHDFKEFASSDVYAFKNKLTLNGRLTTTYKVNANEVLDIDTNVINQLIKDFNAREVDYGYEIPYDSLVNSIQNADKRINFVSLMEPTLTTYVLRANGAESQLVSADNEGVYIKLLAQNILNGKVSLFDYDNRFYYDLGQKMLSGIDMVNEHISKIDTYLNITLADGVEQTLLKNEALQFVAPNVITTLTYPAYVYFRFTSGTHDYNNPVPAKTVYQLSSDESLLMYWTQNDILQTKEYTGANGDIIQANFDLFDTPDDNNDYETINRTVYQKSYNGSNVGFFSLTAQEQIEIKKINKVTLDKKTKCYWLRNNPTNRLFTDDEWSGSTGTLMLKENEYFFYTDVAETQLISLGSGTTITTSLTSASTAEASVVSIEDVLEDGLMALKDKWIQFDFSVNNLVVQENTIFTLTENDTVKVTGADIIINNDNNLVSIPSGVTKIEYQIYGQEPDSLPMYNVTDAEWKVRSRLHLNVSRDEAQVINDGLDTSVSNRQLITFYYDESEGSSEPTYTNHKDLTTTGQCFNLNTELHNEGGSVDLSVVLVDNNVNYYYYPVSLYCYELDTTDNGYTGKTPERNLDNYVKYPLTSDVTNVCKFSIPLIGDEKIIVMMHVLNTDNTGTVTISVQGGATISWYNSDDSFTGELSDGINVFEIENGQNQSSLTITNSGVVGTLTIGTIDFINGFNPALAIKEFAEKVTAYDEETLEGDLLDAIRDSNFYYNCKIDNSKALEYDDILSPYAFYDANNVANKFTISQIDFKASDIDVVRSSKL